MMDTEKEIIGKLLQSKSELIPEEEIEKLFSSPESYQNVLRQIGSKLAEIGLELIRTTFEGKKYFILGISSNTSPIPDDLLGVLIFVTAYLKEHDEKAPQDQFETIFAEVLADVEQLIKQGYVLKKEESYILHPRTKVLLKNIYKNLEFQKLL